MCSSLKDCSEPNEPNRRPQAMRPSRNQSTNTIHDMDVQRREPLSPPGGDGAGNSVHDGAAAGSLAQSASNNSPRPPSASTHYQQQQRVAAESSRTRRSFAFSDTSTAVPSVSPTLSSVAPAGSSTLSGPTLASNDTEPVYTMPTGQAQMSRYGTLMYHLTLEEIRESEREQNRRLAQLPPRSFATSGDQIHTSESDEGPVLGTEQEPMLNEEYAEAIATIEGVSRRGANTRSNIARSHSDSAGYREEWGRGGRGSLMDQRWSSPPDRERH